MPAVLLRFTSDFNRRAVTFSRISYVVHGIRLILAVVRALRARAAGDHYVVFKNYF